MLKLMFKHWKQVSLMIKPPLKLKMRKQLLLNSQLLRKLLQLMAPLLKLQKLRLLQNNWLKLKLKQRLKFKLKLNLKHQLLKRLLLRHQRKLLRRKLLSKRKLLPKKLLRSKKNHQPLSLETPKLLQLMELPRRQKRCLD